MLKNGKILRETIKAYTGMPNNPMSEQQLYQKFAVCCQNLDYATLFERLLKCEKLTEINILTKPYPTQMS